MKPSIKISNGFKISVHLNGNLEFGKFCGFGMENFNIFFELFGFNSGLFCCCGNIIQFLKLKRLKFKFF